MRPLRRVGRGDGEAEGTWASPKVGTKVGGPTRRTQEPGETDGLSALTWTWVLVCLGCSLLLVGTLCLTCHTCGRHPEGGS